jgi:hypothetical protein
MIQDNRIENPFIWTERFDLLASERPHHPLFQVTKPSEGRQP